MSERPDPITGKVTLGAIVGVTSGLALGGVIDVLTNLPTGDAWLDWLRWALALAGAVLAVYAQAQRAKKDTTPVDSPKDRAGNDLVPVGRHEVGAWDETDPPPPPLDIEY